MSVLRVSDMGFVLDWTGDNAASVLLGLRPCRVGAILGEMAVLNGSGWSTQVLMAFEVRRSCGYKAADASLTSTL